MKTKLKEPSDKATTGKDKVAAGFWLIIMGALVCAVIYSAWEAFCL